MDLRWTYSQVIERLMTGPDFRSIGIRLAKRYPEIFVELTSEKEAWRDEFETLIRENKKVEAVKLYRSKMGCGLKEAVDVMKSFEQSIRMDSE